MAKVATWKLEAVEQLKDMLLEYPVVGVVDMAGIPAKQLQKMRSLLRGDVAIKMSRKSIMQHAIEKASSEEKSLNVLEEYIKGQPAFIFSNINPFKLHKILEKNRTSAPAKPDSISPKDILIQKGETPFPPGPLLGEMQQVGIPTTIAEGKIAVKADKVVVRKGETISPRLASILMRLGIEPMEIGLSLLAAHEGDTLFPSEILAVDDAETISDIQCAYREAFNLSINSAYPTREVIPRILSTAFINARTLAVEAGLYEPEIMDLVLEKAYLHASYIDTTIKNKWDELTKTEESKHEAKAEAKGKKAPKVEAVAKPKTKKAKAKKVKRKQP